MKLTNICKYVCYITICIFTRFTDSLFFFVNINNLLSIVLSFYFCRFNSFFLRVIRRRSPSLFTINIIISSIITLLFFWLWDSIFYQIIRAARNILLNTGRQIGIGVTLRTFAIRIIELRYFNTCKVEHLC
jgi:hypothetical protein